MDGAPLIFVSPSQYTGRRVAMASSWRCDPRQVRQYALKITSHRKRADRKTTHAQDADSGKAAELGRSICCDQRQSEELSAEVSQNVAAHDHVHNCQQE